MGKILKMIAQRLGLGLITLLVVSLIIFLGVELLPGDLAEAILGQAATEDRPMNATSTGCLGSCRATWASRSPTSGKFPN
jgi:ABC-type dipeptide/oligopeptide/nickel transport system permease component